MADNFHLRDIFVIFMLCVICSEEITLSSDVEIAPGVHITTIGTTITFTCKIADSVAVVWSAEPFLSSTQIRYTANDAEGVVRDGGAFEGRLTSVTPTGSGRADFITTLTFQAEMQFSELVIDCFNQTETVNATLYLSETNTLTLLPVSTSSCPNQTTTFVCQAIRVPYVEWRLESLSISIRFTALDSTGTTHSEGGFVANITELSLSDNPQLANITTALVFPAKNELNNSIAQCSNGDKNVYGVITIVPTIIGPDSLSCEYSHVNCTDQLTTLECSWNQPLNRIDVIYSISINNGQKQLSSAMVPPGMTKANVTISCVDSTISLIVKLTATAYCNQTRVISQSINGSSELCQNNCSTNEQNLQLLGLLGLLSLPGILFVVRVLIVGVVRYIRMVTNPARDEDTRKVISPDNTQLEMQAKEEVDHDNDPLEVALKELHAELLSLGIKLGIDENNINDTFSNLNEILRNYGKDSDHELKQEGGRKSMFTHLNSLFWNGLSDKDKNELNLTEEKYIFFPLRSLQDAVRARYPGHIDGKHPPKKFDDDTILEAIVRCKWTSNVSLICSCKCCKHSRS